jgi:hypothetical protein
MCLCKEIVVVGAVFRGDDPGAETLIFTPLFNAENNTIGLMTADINTCGENNTIVTELKSGRVYSNT